jgi:hypothetical protein
MPGMLSYSIASAVLGAFESPQISIATTFADALVGPVKVFSQDYIDSKNGDFPTMLDAINTGGEVGGILATICGVPEVGIPAMAFFGEARQFGW